MFLSLAGAGLLRAYTLYMVEDDFAMHLYTIVNFQFSRKQHFLIYTENYTNFIIIKNYNNKKIFKF